MIEKKCDKCGKLGHFEVSSFLLKKYDLQKIKNTFHFCSHYCFRLCAFFVDSAGLRQQRSFDEVQRYIQARARGLLCVVCQKHFYVNKRNQLHCSSDCVLKAKQSYVEKYINKNNKTQKTTLDTEYRDYSKMTLRSLGVDNY